MLIVKKISLSLKEGGERAKLLRKNILQILLYRSVNVIVSFLIVPITINYLNSYEYGIWLTLSSFMVWIELMDLGIANGLRNKLTESISNNRLQLAKEYVSSAYFFLTIISILFFLAFIIVNFFIDWNEILNISYGSNIKFVVIITIFFFSLRFVLKTIGTIFIAYHKPNIDALISAIGSLLSLIIIFILTKTSQGSLIVVSTIFSSIPLLIYFVATLISFNTNYKFIKPGFLFIKKDIIKELLSLGIRFFVIQISCLLIFSSINFLIIRWFGADSVTQYNIAYKYFYTIILAFSIIITPLWSAFTDAYTKKDFIWIKNTVSKIEKIAIIFIIGSLLLLLISDFVYKIWIGDSVLVPFKISLAVCIYVISYILQQTYIYVVNGSGKIFLQTLLSVILTLLFIPASYYLSKIIGVTGIIYVSILSQIPLTIISYIQYRMIVNNKLVGIWNK